VFIAGIANVSPAGAATVTGVVTYKYNNFVGNRGDQGATVYLIRLPVKKPISSQNDALAFKLTAIPGSQEQTIDGFGNVEFDDVAAGEYLVVILSEQTLRDTSQPLDADLTMAIRPLFASQAAWKAAIGPVWVYQEGVGPPPDESILGLKPSVAMPLTIKGDRAHFSYDFGETAL
jgi:hypothetical protein